MSEQLAISTDWLSSESRSEESAAALKAAAVVLANLTADLSVHLPSEQFDPLRDKVVDVLTFLDKMMPLVTPVVPLAKTGEEPQSDPQPVAAPVTSAPKPVTAKQPLPKPAKPVSSPPQTPSNALPSAVAALMSTMSPAAQQAALGALGGQASFTPLRQSLREEATAIGMGTTVPHLLGDALPETITDEVRAATDTFGDPANDYETAVLAVEIWR